MINKKNLIKEIERFIKEKNELRERKESLIIEIENAEKEFFGGKTYREYIESYSMDDCVVEDVNIRQELYNLVGEITMKNEGKIIVTTSIWGDVDVYVGKYITRTGREYEDIPNKYKEIQDKIIYVLNKKKLKNPFNEVLSLL